MSNVALYPNASTFCDTIRRHPQMRRVGPSLPTSPEVLLISEFDTVERVIRFVAARRHLRTSDAEEFASHVKIKLIENDYAVLRKFEGRSSLRTYLTVVIQRMFLDYRDAAWGKWRPSAEAKRAGEVGIVLEQLLWRDGYSFDEACEILATSHRLAVDRSELERVAARLPTRSRRQFESDASLAEHAAASSAEALVDHGERSKVARRISAALRRLIAAAEPQDRLILVFRFADQRTVPQIASMLQIDQKRLYRRLDDLLREIREGLEADGIAAADALAVFDDPAISIDWCDQHADGGQKDVVVAKERPRERQ